MSRRTPAARARRRTIRKQSGMENVKLKMSKQYENARKTKKMKANAIKFKKNQKRVLTTRTESDNIHGQR